MKINVLFFSIVFFAFSTFCQSKKEQIEMLNIQMDSLKNSNSFLNSTIDSLSKTIKIKESELSKTEINSLKISEKELKTRLELLKTQQRYDSLFREQKLVFDNLNPISSESTVPNIFGDSIYYETCFFKNILSVSSCYPDDRGRCDNNFQLFKIDKGTFCAVNNSSIFNARKEQLLQIVNKKIQEEIKLYLSEPEYKDCFDNQTLPSHYSFDQLQIYIDRDGITFIANTFTMEACAPSNTVSVSLSLEYIQSFLN